eukprot:1141146-Rhodomonas_salina.2
MQIRKSLISCLTIGPCQYPGTGYPRIPVLEVHIRNFSPTTNNSFLARSTAYPVCMHCTLAPSTPDRFREIKEFLHGYGATRCGLPGYWVPAKTHGPHEGQEKGFSQSTASKLLYAPIEVILTLLRLPRRFAASWMLKFRRIWFYYPAIGSKDRERASTQRAIAERANAIVHSLQFKPRAFGFSHQRFVLHNRVLHKKGPALKLNRDDKLDSYWY